MVEETFKIKADTSDAVDQIEKLQKQVEELQDEVAKGNEQTKKGLDAVESSSKDVSKGISAIGTSMKAIGIGLIISAFGKLKEVFEQNQFVMDAFNTAFEVVSIAMNDFVNFLISNTSGIVDFFKAIFSDPKQAMQDFADAFKRNIQERFDSYLDTLGFLASAIKKVFSGDFKGALEDVKSAGKESLDVLTGVNDTFDKGKELVEKSAKAVKEYATETFNSAKQNVALAKSSELASAQTQILIEKNDRQAESLRQIRDDERKTIAERVEANNKLNDVLAKQENEMLKLADIQIKSAQVEFDKNKTIENQVALLEAQANKEGILAQITGFRSEQLSNEMALQREQIELTNSQSESRNALAIESERFNAELIDNEVLKLEKLQEIATKERELEQQRLEALIETTNAGTQARIDAQIQLDEFNEASRQEEMQGIKDLEIAKRDQRATTFDQLIELAGAESKVGRALLIAKQGLALKEMIMEAKKTLTFSKMAVAKTSVATAEGTAQTSKIGFPQNIPMLIGYAVQVAGIMSAIKSATQKAGSVAGSFGAGGSVGSPTASAPVSNAPNFNVVGSSGSNQLADVIAGQTQEPIKAFVVANDVTTAQSLENNIVQGASIG